jgi:MoaA/NifB/PqqE/SkfB family radical SAM enzyme
MARCDRGLQRVRAEGSAKRFRPRQRVETAPDEDPVPERAVLIEQENRRPARTRAGPDARRLNLEESDEPVHLRPSPSKGASCRAGETVIAVDGAGDVRRCHFVPEVLGNLYVSGWESVLLPRACPNRACNCHIGYVHRRDLPLYDVFEGGVLERIARRPL